MNKLIQKGKVLVSCVSVLAILAVSMLSMFTGSGVVSLAADKFEAVAQTEPTTYPLNGTYDADVVIKEGGIGYVDANSANKTEVSDFTAFDTTFWLTAEGDGTAANPFIIKNANQFAAVATNRLVYDAGITTSLKMSRYSFVTVGNTKVLDTSGVSFKVAENVKAFNMDNTDSTVDFSGDMTAEAVKSALENATVNSGQSWVNMLDASGRQIPFKGRFDGSGVVIYGLKVSDVMNAGLFPSVAGVTIRNTTLKNSYFIGDASAALVGNCITPDGVHVQSCAVLSNYVVSKRINDADDFGGVVLGHATSNAASGWMTGAFTMLDSLVAGNVATHSKNVVEHNKEYDITYGTFPKITHKDGVVITNSIILDSAPYSIVHASRGFSQSAFTTIYTNMVDCTIENISHYKAGDVEGGNTMKEVSSFVTSGAGYKHQYHKYINDGSDQANYNREYAAGVFFKVDADSAKGSGAKTAMDSLDWSKWTVNANGYPMPKVYQVREYSSGTAWTGDVALFYSGGDGSAASPYIITTAEEFALMLMTSKPAEYYALGDDIIINDTSVADWSNDAKQWFTSNDVPAFKANFDGKGYSVSGIYYSGNQKGEAGGLFPIIGSNANVKNIVIKDSVLNGKSNHILGGLVGKVEDKAAQVVKVSVAVIEDSVKFNGEAKFGGVIGAIGYSSVKLTDSISKSSGLFSAVTGQAEVKRSISVGAYPFENADFIKAEGIYTDTEGLTMQGVTVVANADMKGTAAETAMSGLNFPTSWQVQADDYPKATGAELSANGVKGEVWTGAIANGYAGGNGSPDNPYIIETAEQLALCVYSTEEKHYKLAADIYLNDVNGNLWKDKVGCNEWFTQKNVKNYYGTRNMTFDGDGYVVYGLYINNSNGNDYYRAGLFPQLYDGAHIKNLGISQAYLLGNNDFEDSIGAIAGTCSNWPVGKPDVVQLIKDTIGEEAYNKEPGMPTHDAYATKAITENPIFTKYLPVIENCFVDHNSYISGRYAGGIIGNAGGSFKIKNCIVTASIEASSQGGGFVGSDWCYSSIFEDSLSFTQTCSLPAMGVSHSDWRSKPEYYCSQAIDTYYFAIKRMIEPTFSKISKPDNRTGEYAKLTMTGLDWAGNDEDGTEDIWTVIDGGTPLQTIFAKNRTPEQFESFSDKSFIPPSVTVVFSTGFDDLEVEPLVGSMYFKMSLPKLPDRNGYKFTGWYVFDDLSVEYPYDYFPPRDLTLFAGWETVGVVQDFETYTDTLWDYDENCWVLNKPGAKGGYKNKYVRSGSKSMHLLDSNTQPVDCLLNYEDMLVPEQAYTMTFWVTTDKENNPATLISLVHNEKPDYLNSAVAIENMAVATGLKVGEWVQYSYSFTAKTKWVSLRASGNSSLYFDDIVIASIDGTLPDGAIINISSPNTGNSVSVAVLISAIMSCAIIAIISRKNLVEIIED